MIPKERIFVKTIPNAKKAQLLQQEPTTQAPFCFRAYVTCPPENGKANKALIDMLSEFFKKPVRCFSILKGEHSREKIIEMKTP